MHGFGCGNFSLCKGTNDLFGEGQEQATPIKSSIPSQPPYLYGTTAKQPPKPITICMITILVEVLPCQTTFSVTMTNIQQLSSRTCNLCITRVLSTDTPLVPCNSHFKPPPTYSMALLSTLSSVITTHARKMTDSFKIFKHGCFNMIVDAILGNIQHDVGPLINNSAYSFVP